MPKITHNLSAKIKIVTLFMAAVYISIGLFNYSHLAIAETAASSLIKVKSISSVYYLDADNKRHAFPSESVYFSWYENFSSVKTISETELYSYQLSANVTMRPGTKLIKITTDPSVYAVEPGGVLRKIPSEDSANSLFGSAWAKKVVDVSDAFFTNYIMGPPLTSSAPSSGTLVQSIDNKYYYVDGTSYRQIVSAEAFRANDFKSENIISLNTAISPTAIGSNITKTENVLSDIHAMSLASGVLANNFNSNPATNNPASVAIGGGGGGGGSTPQSRAPTADTILPIITTFTIPATSSSLTVSVTAFTATDNTTVSGYLITESAAVPATNSSFWATTTLTNYTFATAGTKTLYAWAKDEAGNISNSVSGIVIINVANNKTYYVSQSTGSDTYSATQAHNPATPWKTISKINAQTFLPGDSILFKRGDTWTGETITVNSSGNSTSPITYSSYGSGNQPVISGFKDVTSWTNLGNNVWESTNAVSTLSTVNMVAINGVNTAMGRTPNTGYYFYQSHYSTTSITSNNLTGTPNWTGAELAFNNTTYTTLRVPITSQSGGTLTFTPDPHDSIMQKDGLKFIIQNDIRTLDQQNEWYYNPTTKKLSVYSTSQPSGVKVSTVDILVSSTNKSFITFEGLDFTGSNNTTLYLSKVTNYSIKNCNFKYSGNVAIRGIWNHYSDNILIENCIFDQTQNQAINLNGDFRNAIVRNNTINNTGMIYGSGSYLSSISNGHALAIRGDNSLAEYNTINNTGYIAIEFLGNNTIIQKNYITNYSQNQNDGGAIYTWNSFNNYTYSGTKVLTNIIINNPVENGNFGADDAGIYLDGESNGIEVSGNTINSGNHMGIFLGGDRNILVEGNTTFNNATGLRLYNNGSTDYGSTTISNNIFIAKSSTQIAMHSDPLEIYKDRITADNNYYARPTNDTSTIKGFIRTPSFQYLQYTLAQWQTYSGQDANSHTSPVAITDPNDILFDYNATMSDKVVSLGSSTYVDITGATRIGSVTLLPYTSIILIKVNN